MKKIISLIIPLILMTNIGFIFAATGASTKSTDLKADHFAVTVNPISTKVGEAIDLTVKAVDKNGNIVKNYLGTVYITVENDTKASVPYVDGYEFVVADLGEKTFSKGLSFTKEGKMKVSVLDIDNDTLEGSTDVTVSNTKAAVSSSNITISSPDNGVTISEDTVMVSGTTKKNSKVEIFLNSKSAGETQTDSAGDFSYEVKGLVNQTNTITVKVFDGENNIIAESEPIIVNLEGAGPAFKSIIIKEGNEVSASSKINVEVLSEASLLEATVSMDNISEKLKESSTAPGTYVGIIAAPSKAGDYPITVKLKNSLGKTTTKENAVTINIKESNIFKNIKSITGDKKVTFTFDVDPDKDDIINFKFKYGTGSDSLDKEVMTFDKAKIKSASGSYTWYVGNLDITKYYFQIYALDKDQKELGKSDVIDVDLSLASASKCMISNISNFKATKVGDVTNLSWDALAEATSYNVYKKDESGNFNLIENIKTNSYTVNISGDKVKYEDFAVKGVCGNNENESSDFSNATSVQTGPVQIIMLIIISLTFSFFYILVRRKKI